LEQSIIILSRIVVERDLLKTTESNKNRPSLITQNSSSVTAWFFVSAQKDKKKENLKKKIKKTKDKSPVSLLAGNYTKTGLL
jgi:hypothetical protein